MKIGIMQPYLFPYLGYFHLIHSTDQFVFYDDVSFIKQGWINRNRILIQGKPRYFTVPLSSASSNKSICDVKLFSGYFAWCDKFIKTLRQSYAKSPQIDEICDLVAQVLLQEYQSIADLAICSIEACCNYIGLKSEFKRSSREFGDVRGAGIDRVINICKASGAKSYFNSYGGTVLYTKEEFEAKDLSLNFVRPQLLNYSGESDSFIERLSIIDVMMNCTIQELRDHIQSYELL